MTTALRCELSITDCLSFSYICEDKTCNVSITAGHLRGILYNQIWSWGFTLNTSAFISLYCNPTLTSICMFRKHGQSFSITIYLYSSAKAQLVGFVLSLIPYLRNNINIVRIEKIFFFTILIFDKNLLERPCLSCLEITQSLAKVFVAAFYSTVETAK